MNIWIKTAAFGILLGGLGGGTAGLFLGGGLSAGREDGGAEEAAQTTPTEDLSFLEIGQLVAPIREQGRTRAYVLAELQVGFPPQRNQAALYPLRGRLRHAVLHALNSMAARGAFEGETLDLQALAEELRLAANAELSRPPLAERVMFDRLMVQDAL